MDTLIALSVGALVAGAVYLFLARDLPRLLLGFALLGTAANLTIFAAGRIGTMVPPVVPVGAGALAADAANPLPQALILTAIVISFGLAAFALMLIARAYQVLGTLRSENMTDAEQFDAPPATGEAPSPDAPVQRREAA